MSQPVGGTLLATYGYVILTPFMPVATHILLLKDFKMCIDVYYDVPLNF
jgi:hypothetical protein